jgi:hypothetical protein
LKKPRSKTRAGANDAKLVPYQEIRDRFLARLKDDDASRLDSYVSVGRFVVDRWMAEELKREPNQPLDEHACWDDWDQCSEKHLRDLRTEATKLLASEMKKWRHTTLIQDWAHRAEPVRWLLTSLSWFARKAFEGFVGGIGLLLFGLLIVWLMPQIAKSIRSTVNDNLPAETRPDSTADNMSAIGNNMSAPK